MRRGARPLPNALYTPEEAADFLLVSAKTVRRWALAGLLEAVRLGHRGMTVRFTGDAILRCMFPFPSPDRRGCGTDAPTPSPAVTPTARPARPGRPRKGSTASVEERVDRALGLL